MKRNEQKYLGELVDIAKKEISKITPEAHTQAEEVDDAQADGYIPSFAAPPLDVDSRAYYRALALGQTVDGIS